MADDGKITGEHLNNKMKAEIVDLARNCEPSIYVSTLQIRDVVVIDVTESENQPHMCSGGFYKRFDAVTQKLNPHDVRKIFKSEASFHFDSKIDSRCALEDLSLEKVQEFIKETGTQVSVTQSSLPLFLESLKLMDHGKVTHAAIMMFAKDVGKFLLHCQTHLVAFKGTERVHIYDKKYVRDDLLTQFRETESFVKKHLNERAEIKGMRRYDLLEIPMAAIREAIVNAIIHRDYTMSGTNIQIEVLSDRVTISNPGGLPEGLAKSMLGKKSVRRNEILADLFHRMDKSERIGSGIPRILELLKEADLKVPRFESDTFFTVTFERPEEYRTIKGAPGSQKRFPEKVPSKGSQKLGSSSMKIIELIRKNPDITLAEMAESVGISDRAVKKSLAKMKSNGLVLRIGPDKGGRWKVL